MRHTPARGKEGFVPNWQLGMMLSIFALGALRSAARAQITRDVSLPSLEATCIRQHDGACEISVAGVLTTDLHGQQRLPRSLRIRVAPGSRWILHDGTLDFAGSDLIAGPRDRVFYGDGRVTGLKTARPEWFAFPDASGVYPRDALRGAYRATSVGGTIQMSAGGYLSPFFDPALGTCGGATLGIDQPRTLLGGGRPEPDSSDHPTRLIGGTVILGEVCGTGPLKALHLGIDEGAYADARYFGGKAAFGIQLTSGGRLGRIDGTRLEDLSVLTTGLEDQHSVIVEGQRHVTVQDLWIWTTGGTHGLVMKSYDSLVSNFHCEGASSDCLILKSDYATDGAGRASNDRFDGVYLRFLQHPGDTGGIVLDGRWDSLKGVTLRNLHEQGLSSGLQATDSIFHQVRDVHVDHWIATDIFGPCLVLEGTKNFTVTDATCTRDPSAAGSPDVLRRPHPILIKGNLRILYTQTLRWLSLLRPFLPYALAGLLCLTVVLALAGRRRRRGAA